MEVQTRWSFQGQGSDVKNQPFLPKNDSKWPKNEWNEQDWGLFFKNGCQIRSQRPIFLLDGLFKVRGPTSKISHFCLNFSQKWPKNYLNYQNLRGVLTTFFLTRGLRNLSNCIDPKYLSIQNTETQNISDPQMRTPKYHQNFDVRLSYFIIYDF